MLIRTLAIPMVNKGMSQTTDACSKFNYCLIKLTPIYEIDNYKNL